MSAGFKTKKALSRGKALMGAFRFFCFVMQFEDLDIIINDAQLWEIQEVRRVANRSS